MKRLLIINIKNKRYVTYNKEQFQNYYNEIYEYILDNTKLPGCLQNKNKKTIKNKRNKFHKLVKNKYQILNIQINIYIPPFIYK